MGRPAELQGNTAVEALGEAVERAVRRQAVADVPVGSFLSGGVDSPLVAAELRNAIGDTVPTFTFATTDPRLDESIQARRYAETLGLANYECRISSSMLAQSIQDVILSCSEPLEDPSLFPTLAVCRQAQSRVKVLLSGDGGDDILWGYPQRQNEIIKSLIRKESTGGRRRLMRYFQSAARLGSRAQDRPSIGARYLSVQRFLDIDRLKRVIPDLPVWPSECNLFDFDSSDVDEVAQWIRWNEYSGHLPRILLKVDRASMFNSMEVRVPLLDKEVLAVAGRVHWSSCLDVSKGIGKIPLRTLLKRHMGKTSPGKRGFMPPMRDWLINEFRPFVNDALLSRNEILGLPVNLLTLQETYKQHCRGRVDATYLLWRLLSLSLWETHHFTERSWRLQTRFQ